jgi:hypothetical protein
MSNLYSVISFLAFFFLATLLLDICLPRKQEVSSIKNDLLFANSNEQVLVIIESTPILHQTISITRLINGTVKNEMKTSLFYFPGFIFIIFLIIGSIYGVFMKKPPYLERRAAYYNIIVGSALFILLFASFFQI